MSRKVLACLAGWATVVAVACTDFVWHWLTLFLNSVGLINTRLNWLGSIVALSMVTVPGLIVTALIAYRHVIPPNHCRKCGYDLTGNESGTCPECGTEAERL